MKNAHHETHHNHGHNSKLQRKSSFDEAQELKKQRKQEIDSRIKLVFNEDGDEEFRQALLEDKSIPHSQVDLVDKKMSSHLLDDEGLDSERYKLQLDGFEIGSNGGGSNSKRLLDEGSVFEGEIDLNEFEAKRKKKAGIYDLEPVEKLKEKGYNLFLDITDAYGE